MSHHKNSIEELGKKPRENRSLKSQPIKNRACPICAIPHTQGHLSKFASPTASGRDGAQALAEVVKSASGAWNFILRTR
jgi:hypothetical protein